MKRCSKCNEEKPEAAFYRRTDGRLHASCKACMATRFSSYYAANKRTVLSRMIRNAYGITYEEYLALLEAAGFRCESCGEPVLESGTGPREQVANVDHCHATGTKRKAQLKIPRAS